MYNDIIIFVVGSELTKVSHTKFLGVLMLPILFLNTAVSYFVKRIYFPVVLYFLCMKLWFSLIFITVISFGQTRIIVI